MKLKMFFTLLAIGAISLQSCDRDDDEIAASKVPQTVRNAFGERYPDTRNLKWELELVSQQQYYKAEFRNPKESDHSTSAWYTTDGTWVMTETEMLYSAIPAAIRTSFESSTYASWKRDNEVDKLERVGVATVYIIDVESPADEDVDLYYSEDGVLIKAISEAPGSLPGDGSLLPNIPSGGVAAVTAAIKEKYPTATIVEVDVEGGIIEVDIIDGGVSKEVLLNSSHQWISTSWDVHPAALPDVIKSAITASQYSTYRIDDADYVETPTGDYYLVELESGKVEVKVKIDLNGQFIV